MPSLACRANNFVREVYYDYETYCFRGEMSAPKRLIDSKEGCPLSFLLELLLPLWEYKTKKQRIA